MASQDSQQQTATSIPPPSLDRQSRSSPGPPSQSETATPLSQIQSDPAEPPPQLTPRLQALATKKANHEATLEALKTQRAALVANSKLPSGLAMPDSWTEDEKTRSALASAHVTIKEHITLLHKYNEIKDIGQGLMGLIADSRGARVAAVMEDYGMGEKD